MKKTVFLTTIILCLTTLGCVERMITVTSSPAGAIVWLNDQEVGATPVTVPFTWYGTYDVVLRKDGYETICVPKKTPVPWYQIPAVDFVAETLMPFTVTDKHQWDFILTTQIPTDPEKLIQRAQDLRTQTINSQKTSTKN